MRGLFKMKEKIKELELKIENLEVNSSVISQVTDSIQEQINTKVDKDKVISSINISEEDVRIKGDKIRIDSHTLIEGGTMD